LKKSLSDGSEFARQKAAMVVGYYTSDRDTLESLSKMATADPVDEVRSAAADAKEQFIFKLKCLGEAVD